MSEKDEEIKLADPLILMRNKILFVSATGRLNRPYFDPSVRYRCFNIAEELSNQGDYCRVTTAEQFINDDMDEFDVYVFHRPPFSPGFINKVQALQENGKVVIADYDDLTFDIENALSSSLYKSGRATQREVLNIFSRNAAALSIFDNYTVSTTALANRIKVLRPASNVIIVHNALTEKFKAICDQIRLNESIERVKGRVGYFSGTKSHDNDIELIASALVESCGSSTGREVLFVGPVDIPAIVKNKCKTVISPLVGYHEMIKLICTCEVVIAPLEDSVFNSCKSGLKYFESAYAGCNVVATPIPDVVRFKSETLYTPSTIKKWRAELNNAVSDFSTQSMEARLDNAASQASMKVEIGKWHSFVQKLLVNLA